jgi:hypothetical protein
MRARTSQGVLVRLTSTWRPVGRMRVPAVVLRVFVDTFGVHVFQVFNQFSRLTHGGGSVCGERAHVCLRYSESE